MYTIQGVRFLYEQTHARLDLVLMHASTLPPDLFTQSVPGFGSTSIRDQLVHILSVENGWIANVRSSETDRLVPAEYQTVDDVVRVKDRTKATTLAYLNSLNSLNDTTLNQILLEQPTKWSGPLRSPGFIVHHIITHTFHHKGQMGSMFRLLGYPIGDTDLQRDD